MLLDALGRLEIPHMVGGSLASSVHGVWRATNDVDIVASIPPEYVDELVRLLEPDYYIDEGQVRDALRRGRPFNVIHFKTSYKFDIIPLARDRFAQVQFGRRRWETSERVEPPLLEFCVATPEDIILSKLEWFLRGGRVSEKQWNDVLGVIAVQRERLDLAYLREWAEYLKISDLLEQALAERHEPGFPESEPQS